MYRKVYVGNFGGTHPVTRWANKNYSVLGCDAVLLNCFDVAAGEVCGSLASCVQQGMRSVARLRNAEGLSGVPAVWPVFVGMSRTGMVFVHNDLCSFRECLRSSTTAVGRFYC